MFHSKKKRKKVAAGAKESGITQGCFIKKERKREGKTEETNGEKKEGKKKIAGRTKRPRRVFVFMQVAFSVSSANHVKFD